MDIDWILFDFDPPQQKPDLHIDNQTMQKNKPETSHHICKGTCPLCQRYIGRGISFHIKYCKG